MATSVEGFVQQLAVAYVTHGYWFYVTGQIPERKDTASVDRKLVERYGIAISKWARARRKKQGLANMQYLRHERTFVLLATRGRHEFFEREKPAVHDIRRAPIKFAGYSIGCRKGRDGRWHASVRMERSSYESWRAYVLEACARRPAGDILFEIHRLAVARYAPVRRQILSVALAVNRFRRRASLELLPLASLKLARSCIRPFLRAEGRARVAAQR